MFIDLESSKVRTPLGVPCLLGSSRILIQLAGTYVWFATRDCPRNMALLKERLVFFMIRDL